MFKKLLIACDFSQISDQILEDINEFKEMGLEKVILLNVLPEGKEDKLNAKNSKELDKRKKQLEAEDIKVETILEVGVPAFNIKEVSEKEEVDLIIIGSRGHNPLLEFFLGSTALTFIRITTKPTLVIKEKKRKKDKVKMFSRVILPVDFSKYSNNVLRWAMDQDLTNHVDEYLLIHVWTARDDVEKWKDFARQRLEEMKSQFLSKDLKARTFLRGGFPTTQIKELAGEEEASLIIMATRGMGKVMELPLGSIAEGVARESELPVILLPRLYLV